MLRNAMSVLELYTPERSDLGVTEAAELLGRDKSTLSRWLSAMERAGFLERDPDTSRYRLSLRLAALGDLARRSTTLQRLAHPIVEGLAQATGETANLVILTKGEAVNVQVAESPQPLKHVGWLGRRLPLHATAAGKGLLAWRPRDVTEALLPLELPRFTAHTLVTRAAVMNELEHARRNGYAQAWCELEDEVVGIAAPVRDHSGLVAAVLTISAPSSRVPLDRIPELAVPVQDAATNLSELLGWRASDCAAGG